MTAHATAPPVDAQVLGGLLLDLYRFARELPLADFQRRVLERLSEALPFDSAWWGMSELDRELHSSFPFRLPADYVDAWRAIRGHDLMADAVIGTPSVTANFDTARLHATPTFAAFMDAYGIRQSMCTLLMNPTLNLTTFLSLYRQGPDAQPFSEAERQFKQLVMPHLWAAWTSNWISQLASAKAQLSADLAQRDEVDRQRQAIQQAIGQARAELAQARSDLDQARADRQTAQLVTEAARSQRAELERQRVELADLVKRLEAQRDGLVPNVNPPPDRPATPDSRR